MAKVEFMAYTDAPETSFIEYNTLEELEYKIKKFDADEEVKDEILKRIRRVKRKPSLTRRELEFRSKGMQETYIKLKELSYEQILELEYLLQKEKEAKKDYYTPGNYDVTTLGKATKALNKFLRKYDLERFEYNLRDVVFAIEF